MSQERFAIVGAGIAGLSTARALARAGFEVIVFDKARGVGGRTSTRRREPDAFDHGAQYFTCRTPSFAARVDEWCREGRVARWDGPVWSIGPGGGERESDPPRRFVGIPGMSAVARGLADGLSVECGARIERIRRSSGEGRHWRLETDCGRIEGDFDGVIVAAPAPQAAALLEPVPALQQVASEVEMLPCQATLVTFAKPLPLEFGGAFVEDEVLAWAAHNASKPGRPDRECWVLHANSQWTRGHLDATPQAIIAPMLEAFARVTQLDLPPTLHATTHCWRLARPTAPLDRLSLWEPDERVGVCGDWLCGSRVEDAYRSGEHLAERILRSAASARVARQGDAEVLSGPGL